MVRCRLSAIDFLFYLWTYNKRRFFLMLLSYFYHKNLDYFQGYAVSGEWLTQSLWREVYAILLNSFHSTKITYATTLKVANLIPWKISFVPSYFY